MREFENKLDLILKKFNKDIDLDWSEIAEELGLDCSSDHLRKTAYGIKEYHEYIQSKGMDCIAKEMKETLHKQLLKMQQQKILISDLRTQLNKENREAARYNDILKLLENNITKLKETKPLFETYIESNVGEKQLVVLLSDIHYGIDIDNHWNKFNSNIAKIRMDYLVNRIIDIANQHSVSIVNVLVLGDEIAGHLHITNRLENRESTTEQLIGVSELISEAINKVANNVEYVSVGFVNGNHSRVFADKSQNTNRDYLTILVKEFVKLRLDHRKNVVFLENNVSNDIVELNLWNKYRIVGVHGHNDRINNCVSRLTGMLRYIPDFVVMGHYHKVKEDTDYETEICVNGSYSGTDEYAASLRLSSKPMQKVMVFSKKYGRECNYNIDLSKEV